MHANHVSPGWASAGLAEPYCSVRHMGKPYSAETSCRSNNMRTCLANPCPHPKGRRWCRTVYALIPKLASGLSIPDSLVAENTFISSCCNTILLSLESFALVSLAFCRSCVHLAPCVLASAPKANASLCCQELHLGPQPVSMRGACWSCVC